VIVPAHSATADASSIAIRRGRRRPPQNRQRPLIALVWLAGITAKSGATAPDDSRSDDRHRNDIRLNLTAQGYRDGARLSAFECGADELTLAPDQAAFPHRAKLIEGNSEFEWQNAETAQSDAGSIVCGVADAARMNLVLPRKKQERVAVNNGSALRAPLEDVVSLSERSLVWCRHGMGLWFSSERTKPPGGGRSPAALFGPERDNIRCRSRYRFRAPLQRKSPVKIDAGAAG
jgi:hypothetical protein